MTMHGKVARTLYKNLLRTIKPFTSKKTGPILTSLLHRSGSDDHIDYLEYAKIAAASAASNKTTCKTKKNDNENENENENENGGGNPSAETNTNDKHHDVSSSSSSTRNSEPQLFLSREQARDLSHSYSELQRKNRESESYQSDDTISQGFPPYEYEFTSFRTAPHIILYKSILKDIIGHHRHMNFPTSTSTSTSTSTEIEIETVVMDRLRDIIKREFRESSISISKQMTSAGVVEEKHRRDAAFLAIKELQKKLLWAESSLNIDLSEGIATASDADTGTSDASANAKDTCNGKNSNILIAKDVKRLPLQPASSYLKTGTYLVAHPLLTGCFSKSVICLLEHTVSEDHSDDNTCTGTEEGGKDDKVGKDNHVDDSDGDQSDNDKDNNNNNKNEKETTIMYKGMEIPYDPDPESTSEPDPELKPESESESESGPADKLKSEVEAMGGTYGIIVNKPLRTGIPHHTSTQTRDRKLREVIRHDCLPEGVKVAFGDCSVRTGGPVNVSLQMLRSATSEEDDNLKIGGSLLSMVVDDDNSNNNNNNNDNTSEDAGIDSSTGGQIKSTAMDTDAAVYFAGDIIKASQAIIDKDMNKDSFSFVVGASCWEEGQLESEIERGYWIPCAGPPQIAFAGACDISGVGGITAMETSLWSSFMAALGEEEGRLAQVFENYEFDENGLPCDEV